MKARLPVSEVVGRRVKLRKAGREWKGLSPFNQEKTPSFFVNDQKMAWFDFSSGKNGSIFDFVMTYWLLHLHQKHHQFQLCLHR